MTGRDSDKREMNVPCPAPRTGLIIIRMSEAVGTEQLRAMVTVYLDLDQTETTKVAASSVEALCALIQAWTYAFLSPGSTTATAPP